MPELYTHNMSNSSSGNIIIINNKPYLNDTTHCPICNLKLKNVFINKFPHKSTFIQRTCSGINHSLQFLSNPSNKIDIIKFSLNPKYSKFIEIDFVNNKSIINSPVNNIPNYISIPKIIYPDFPLLLNLKNQVKFYTTFS